MLNTSTDQIISSLVDIASNIQIEPNFRIHHPNYLPFALPDNVAHRFQRNSLDLQHKCLALLLRNFLYGVYYNGSLQKILAVSNKAQVCESSKKLDENCSVGIDWNFYQQLHENNFGTGYYDPNWRVLRLEPDGSIAVTKDGLTLYVEPECYLPSTRSPIVEDLIAIWMPKNRLHNGCYVAVSNVRWEETQEQKAVNSHLGRGRIYLNLKPSGAIALMASLTKQLNSIAIPFSFEVLYNPTFYGRYDAAMLNFEISTYGVIHQVLQTVYQEHQAYFQPDIPLFTKFLAPGVGLAEEPDQKSAAQESFGLNRCQIVANALLEAWRNGKMGIEERLRVIEQHFAQHFIDIHHPYLNPNSEDIYSPI
jgi:hypothetical protein